MNNYSTSQRGFSMIELIVVIGVVSLLLSILAPALRTVAASGRTTQCAANLRQMALAVTNYSSIHDAFPPAVTYHQRDGVWQTRAWDWVQSTFEGQIISPGPLWTFTDDPGEVMQCPSYYGSSNFGDDPFTGYNYNTSYLGAEQAFLIDAFMNPGTAPHRCLRSSTCAMFGCGGFAGGANKFMRAPSDPTGVGMNITYAGGQAFRHLGASNAAFVDGHVESILQPRPGASSTAYHLKNVMKFPDNGFLSDDDSSYRPN